jgi:hypothetical protein
MLPSCLPACGFSGAVLWPAVLMLFADTEEHAYHA